MVGGKGSTVVFYAALVMFSAFFAIWLLDFALLRADWCTGQETNCFRDWLAALSGWAAAIAAGVTIFVLMHQVADARALREEDEKQRKLSIANALLIDLVDTSDRVRWIGQLADLEPPMSQTARNMIADATRVSPALAVALQRHCTEIGAFTARLRRAPTSRGEFYRTDVLDRDRLAFRARVLARCFAGASTQIENTGRAAGKFVDEAELIEFQRDYRVTVHDRGYLSQVFETTGLGP